MDMENREFDYEVIEEIKTRWSPRAFDPEREVPADDLMGMLEAARYAPSCFNDQPWRFLVGRRGDSNFERIKAALTDSNREWASRASVLMMILSMQNFEYNQKPNRWHLFDAGTAWGYLSLEAERRGLITHAMAGYNRDQIRETFGVPEELSIIAAVAVGYYGDKEALSPKNFEKEKPSPRVSIQEILYQSILKE